jgi:AcrR family transcriptional regulator
LPFLARVEVASAAAALCSGAELAYVDASLVAWSICCGLRIYMKHQTFRSRQARRQRVNDPEGTRRNILEVATLEFADKGFSGARVDEIAARTKTSKRMIYYYFGGKEGLYIAVLEETYRRIRNLEATLDLAQKSPEEALRALVGFTFDYYVAHPELVRLVMNENVLNGIYLSRSTAVQRLNVTVIDAMRDLLDRGRRDGAFRRGLDPVELHMTISALGFFNVANRATFSTIFKLDMTSPGALAARRAQVVDIVLRYVKA